jgi:toxin CptA
MSIAVSAMIRHSPSLRAAQMLLCAALLACAWVADPVPACVLLAGALAGSVGQRGKVNLARIDISGVGQVRLTVYLPDEYQQGAQLLPGCTLWPCLLLLRLRCEQGGVTWLVVLPDSAPRDVRRRLALACRAIAARGTDS